MTYIVRLHLNSQAKNVPLTNVASSKIFWNSPLSESFSLPISKNVFFTEQSFSSFLKTSDPLLFGPVR